MNDGWIKKVRCSGELEAAINTVLEDFQYSYPQFIKEAVENYIDMLRGTNTKKCITTNSMNEPEKKFKRQVNTPEDVAKVLDPNKPLARTHVQSFSK
jgi:hypothetical protein